MDLEILNSDDYNVEYDDLLREKSDTNQEDSYTTEDSSSPVKKQPQQQPPVTLNSFFPLCLGHVLLSPDPRTTNGVSNELFQVTNHLHKQQGPQLNQLYDVFGLNEAPDMFGGKRLNNDKVDKLVSQLSEVDKDLEMDDKQRTRVFKGRFKSDIPQSDALDHQLSSYLDSPSINDENKENVLPFPDPLKGVKKDQHTIKKSSKVFFKSSRRNGTKSSIPVLQPLSNLANTDLKRAYQESQHLRDQSPAVRSPKRVCSPRHATMGPSRPSIRHHNPLVNIFVVDSLTGLINDATQFGTELNASNCEGFPLPDDIHEIVQIPTNVDTRSSKKARAKMAIIKAYHTKQYPSQQSSTQVGFYTVKEFEKYQQMINLPVTVTLQEAGQGDMPKKVKWADQLEW